MFRIALDAMGTDRAPRSEIAGVALALSELPPDFTLTLVGPRAVIEEELLAYPDLDRSRISFAEAAEVIGMDEQPLQAIRKKRHSSIVVGLQLHAAGEADAFISAGNTGALLAGSTVILGLHEGVDRATVGTLLPTLGGRLLFLDSGANLECSARELVNFALLGCIYMKLIHGRESPKVGLLNVGEEEGKGTAIEREAFAALHRDSRLNFIGNIEGRDIAVPHPVHGSIDVVVTDGFVGNVVLKFYESMGTVVHRLMAEANPALLTAPELEPMRRFLDYSEQGGAPLLGVRGHPIICHGSSTPMAIRNAIRLAIVSAENDLSDNTNRMLSSLSKW